MQSEYPILGLVPILVFGLSFFLVSNSINNAIGQHRCLILRISSCQPIYRLERLNLINHNFGWHSIIGFERPDIEIRQSGGFFSETIETADVSITYDGNIAFDRNVPFSIDRNDMGTMDK